MKKITCDLCGGTLQIDAGGQSASCMDCGMPHSIERVREKLKTTNSSNGNIDVNDEHKETLLMDDGIVDTDDEIILDGEIVTVIDDDVDTGEVPIPVDSKKETIVHKTLKDHTLRLKVESVTTPLFIGNIVIGARILNGTLFPNQRIFLEGNPNISCVACKLTDSFKKELKHAKAGKSVKITVTGILKKHIAIGSVFVREQLSPGFPATDCYSYADSPEKYFEQLLHGVFSEYNIKQNVVITNSTPSVPVSYLFMKENRPVLAIILCGSREYKTQKILNTMQACESRGIPVQRYYTSFRNSADYVCERIRSELK